MAPPNPKRPPRPPRPPGTQAPKDSDVELPFDDDEVAPLQADDPRPQRVPQFPAGSRKPTRQGGGRGRERGDRELSAKFDWGREYSNPGHPPAFLYVERGPGAGQLVPVQPGTLVLGRSSSSDLRLQHPSISRRHAQVTRKGDQIFLKDLGSQNGTFINRNRITDEVEVMSGDEITLGNAMMRLRGPGGTPAAGLPAFVGDVATPAPRKRGLSPLGVGLVAAGLGSAVAALFTVLAVGLNSNRTVSTDETARTARPSASSPAPSSGATPADTERPLLVDPSNTRPPEGTRTESSRAAGEDRAPTNTGVSARDIAAGTRRVTAPSGAATSGTGGLSARDIASGTSAGRTSAPEEALAPSTNPSKETGVRDLSAGVTRAPSRGTAPVSAQRVANGEVAAFPDPTDSGASTVAKNGASTKPRSGKPTGPTTEAEVLRLYEANNVSAALELAKAGRFNTLHAQLSRFDSALSEMNKALAKEDTARAISQLTIAVRVDQELAKGWSQQGPELRKQLSDLYVRLGKEHVKARNPDAAREAYTQALKNDKDNRLAIEGLRRLDSAATAP
ncbi:FHA domain-containing protein [Myxococcus stipitatus]|uniref:FHA domain-containing protein n=1 Tax=Myxococcus stipitatus TaxID=83455 RepID=UPI0031450A10